LDVLSAITVAHRACVLSFKNNLAIIPGNLPLLIHAFRYWTEAMVSKRLGPTTCNLELQPLYWGKAAFHRSEERVLDRGYTRF